MDQLEQARAQIDAIDAQMAALFTQRMQAVVQVAQYKAATGKPVFDPAREDALIAKNTARVPGELCAYYRRFLQQSLAVSRAYQRRLLGRDVAAYQGVQGAWSHIALTLLLPFASAKAYATWADVCDAVEAGDAQYGVLPFENSNAGDVSAVLRLCSMHARQLTVARMASLPIRQDLLALPGATLAGIRTVVSHQQALAQSSPFLKSHGLEARPWGNTADAARHVAESGDKSLAAIASAQTAELYGLQITRQGRQRGRRQHHPLPCRRPRRRRRAAAPGPPAAAWRCCSRSTTSPASWPTSSA